MTTLSQSEMLALWRRNLGLEPRRTDCSITAYEGIDIDDIILRQMRRWYLNLLDTLDPHLIPTADVAARAAISPRQGGGCEVKPPVGVRRPLTVKLRGWQFHAPVLRNVSPERLGSFRSPFLKPGPRTPLAVLSPDGTILAFPAGDVIEELRAVIDPGPDTYTLDESLLPLP